MTGTLASEFPIRCLLRKNFILTRRARCQNKSAGQVANIMTIVRSISPEAKALYKMRRENLKQISRVLQLQMKSGAADFDSVNEGLIQIYSADGVHTAFKTFQQWKEEGKSVIKGEKAFSVWGSPRKVANPEPEEGENDEFKYWPLCYLFSNAQVHEPKHFE